MGLRIEHRTEQGVMVLSTRASLASLAARVVATGEELVVINQRTGSTLVKFTIPASSPPMSIVESRPEPTRASSCQLTARPGRTAINLATELSRHDLTLGWDALMDVVERRGWYVIPATPSSSSGRYADASRHVVLGVGSVDAHMTLDGWGRTFVEALGWAVVRALDSVERRPIA